MTAEQASRLKMFKFKYALIDFANRPPTFNIDDLVKASKSLMQFGGVSG